MKDYLISSTDIRQSPSWAKYMESIGWNVVKIDSTYVYIKKIKYLNRSMIKIQHAKKINFKDIEKITKKYNPLFIVMEPHVFGFKEYDYLKNGFKKSKLRFAPSSTIKIDLKKNSKEVFKSFSENARRNIKKAQGNNLEIKIIDLKKDKDFNSFDNYFSLLQELTKKKGFFAPGREESFKKMKAFKDNSVLFFAYENNNPIAVVWFGYFDNVITYMQTGINERGYKLLANYLLVWEGILWAQKKRFKIFDFESIYDSRNPHENKKWLGFSEFKKRFHGEIVEYPSSYSKYYNFIFKLFEVFSR